MAIVRAPRPQSHFYMLDKSISEDRRLSWAARGLLIYLLGKPDHWAVSPAALVNETRDCAKPSGRDSTYGLLRELLTVGYLRRDQSKKDGGQFDSVDYVISETAQPMVRTEGTPHTDSPHTDLPYPGQPHTANPTQVSTDSKQGLREASIEVAAGPSAPARRRAKAEGEAPTSIIWRAYADAYTRRYGVAPVRNAKVNGQLSQFLTRLGADESPHVAAFYVGHNNRYYVQKLHAVDCLLADAEKLRTEWVTGRRVTATAAQEADRIQETGDMWDRIIEDHERMEG